MLRDHGIAPPQLDPPFLPIAQRLEQEQHALLLSPQPGTSTVLIEMQREEAERYHGTALREPVEYPFVSNRSFTNPCQIREPRIELLVLVFGSRHFTDRSRQP